jgi:hypothetical protein
MASHHGAALMGAVQGGYTAPSGHKPHTPTTGSGVKRDTPTTGSGVKRAVWPGIGTSGPKVKKVGGDYEWDGVLCAEFETPDGKPRVVVAHPVQKGWVLHIYRPDQIIREA